MIHGIVTPSQYYGGLRLDNVSMETNTGQGQEVFALTSLEKLVRSILS